MLQIFAQQKTYNPCPQECQSGHYTESTPTTEVTFRSYDREYVGILNYNLLEFIKISSSHHRKLRPQLVFPRMAAEWQKNTLTVHIFPLRIIYSFTLEALIAVIFGRETEVQNGVKDEFAEATVSGFKAQEGDHQSLLTAQMIQC